MWYMVLRRENMYVNNMVYHEQIWKLHMEVLGKMLIYWTMYIVLTQDPRWMSQNLANWFR